MPPAAPPNPPEPVPGRRRVALRWLRYLLTAGALLVLGLSAAGQSARDRTVTLALLFFAPVLPIGLGVALLDLAYGGRCLPRPRFGLALLGLTAGGWSAASLMGGGAADDRPNAAVGLLQWNVEWGGGNHRGAATWAALLGDIRARSPDIIVLSEAPEQSWAGWADAPLAPPGWSSALVEHPPDSPYWYRMVVASRWPIEREWDRPVPHGHVMAVVIECPGRPLRLLAVDGESNPFLLRREMLDGVTELCRAGQVRGERIDLLAGDFNTPSRSIGFDAFAEMAGGYRLASRRARGWRGTYPAACPLLDIDHVWLHRDFPIRGCELFGSAASDHRGQFVRFDLPP